MALNPASNYANLSTLSSLVLNAADASGNNPVKNLIQTFLSNISSTTYTPMAVALTDASNNFAIGANSSLRILLAIDDGTVAFDSSKGEATNTYANFNSGTGTINASNHNTRPEIMTAVLGNSGVGLSERFSKTTGKYLKYQANRMGNSTQNNLGTFRVSLDTTL